MEFWDLNISLIFMIFMILLVRKLGNRYIPKRVVMLLWNLIIIRALVPCKISISSIPILKNLKGIFSDSQNTVVLPKISASVQEAFSQNTILNSGEMLNTCVLLKMVWILGVFCIGVYFLRIYYAQYKKLRKRVPVHNEIAERVIRSVSLRRKDSEVTEEETEFVRMSDEEYERVMKDIRENYNDPYQKLTEEQERALRQQRLDQAEEIFNDMQFNLR